jgi:hypothetical protein
VQEWAVADGDNRFVGPMLLATLLRYELAEDISRSEARDLREDTVRHEH